MIKVQSEKIKNYIEGSLKILEDKEFFKKCYGKRSKDYKSGYKKAMLQILNSISIEDEKYNILNAYTDGLLKTHGKDPILYVRTLFGKFLQK